MIDSNQACPICRQPVISGAPQGLCPACLLKSGFETREGDNLADKPPFVPPSVTEIAKIFPQLEIIQLLGQGGMGAVYKARQIRLNRPVALKILSPEKQNDPQFAERFAREARALAALMHPNIVAVYDFGEAQGNFYLLMEFVDGLTLRQLYRSSKPSASEVLKIVPKICDALQYAHDHGVVHRDIKPENILIDKNCCPKIADFGIAKILALEPGDVSLTGAKDVIGTPLYMSPEQLERPETVDSRADIYSLGVVFYEMLTGELPIGKFQPPSKKVQIDVRIDEVVLQTLEKEPARRYQKVSELKTAVETIATAESQRSPQAKSGQPSTGTTKDAKTAVVIFAVGLAVLIIPLGFAAWFLAKKYQSPPSPSIVVANTNSFENLLNIDQRVFLHFINSKFGRYFDERTFEGWAPLDRAALEWRLLDVIKGPRSNDYYQAINTLGALRSTNALPQLKEMAFEHNGKLARLESSNRRQWMAVRALGIIDDKSVVPQMIHALYHHSSYVRWSAQISLVRLTGQNFGSDWEAWGRWWNEQKGNPPFNPEVVLWWHGQAEPKALAKEQAEVDQKFLEHKN